MPKKTIFLTGASGTVGGTLLPRLSEHHPIALVHRTATSGESVRGDLTQPQLGLSRETYDAIADRIDLVIHSAAMVDFAADEKTMFEVNVEGTRHVLDLCQRAQAPLLHVSTAFVHRAEMAARVHDPDAVVNPKAYIHSKRAAESLVQASGVPATILRPSVIVGDSVTGAVDRFQTFYNTVEAIARTQLPILPIGQDTQLDLVPQDVVADALAALASQPIDGKDYWITGGHAALTVRRIIELVQENAQRLGIPARRIPAVPAATAERMLRTTLFDDLPMTAIYRLQEHAELGKVFDNAPPFPSTIHTIPGGPAPLTIDSIERTLAAVTDHVVRATGPVDVDGRPAVGDQ